MRKNGIHEFAKLSLSAGICMSVPGEDFEEVYNNADKALYYVKRSGKGGKAVYETADNFEKNHSNIELLMIMQKLKRVKTGQNAAYGYQGKEMEKLLTRLVAEQRESMEDYAYVMITLENGPGETHFIEEIEDAMSGMEYSVKEVVGSHGECIRYSNVQFLLVYKGSSGTSVEAEVEKVISEFYKHCNETGLQPSYAIEMMPYEWG